MQDYEVKFHRTAGGDWRTDGALPVTICDSTFTCYLDLPEEQDDFHAIFTQRKPQGSDHFRLVYGTKGKPRTITLKTEEYICFFEEATDLMSDMYSRGYRYLRVEY